MKTEIEKEIKSRLQPQTDRQTDEEAEALNWRRYLQNMSS